MSDHDPGLTALRLRLYVAGTAPNSVAARANLSALLAATKAPAPLLEVVDVLEEPLRARADGVIVAPALMVVGPGPTRQIVGNLCHRALVARALGLEDGDA